MHADELDAAADRPPLRPRQALRWTDAEQAFGSAEPALLNALAEAGTPFDPDPPSPQAHLDAMAAQLRRLGLCGRWRDEAVRLPHPDGPLHIERGFQLPFEPTHEAMAALNLHRGQPPHELAANLRRAFSGIVAGNVKEGGMRAIEEHGPFDIDGDRDIMQALDALLASFVFQQRMKLPGARYVPCYRIHAA